MSRVRGRQGAAAAPPEVGPGRGRVPARRRRGGADRRRPAGGGARGASATSVPGVVTQPVQGLRSPFCRVVLLGSEDCALTPPPQGLGPEYMRRRPGAGDV